jgi:cyclase
MKRCVVLGTLLTAGGLSITLAAFQQSPASQPAPKVIEVDKLKDNLFVLKGGGGNTAVFITANGVVVVDTKLPGWGQPILDKIKTLTDKPVTTISTRTPTAIM